MTDWPHCPICGNRALDASGGGFVPYEHLKTSDCPARTLTWTQIEGLTEWVAQVRREEETWPQGES